MQTEGPQETAVWECDSKVTDHDRPHSLLCTTLLHRRQLWSGHVQHSSRTTIESTHVHSTAPKPNSRNWTRKLLGYRKVPVHKHQLVMSKLGLTWWWPRVLSHCNTPWNTGLATNLVQSLCWESYWNYPWVLPSQISFLHPPLPSWLYPQPRLC